jgi:endophilin-B
MCFNMDFKKLASEAGTLFSRAKQYTEEKLGQAERTELDAHVENLLQKADRTKYWTERILSQTEAVLQPNPNVRLEEFIYEKVQGKKPVRLVEDDVLGQHMLDAGNEFGPQTPYGSTLIRCGQTQQKLGQTRREFIEIATSDLLQPFNAFLEGDMKTIQKERRIMETKRLDLDAAKSRLRRAKSQQAKESEFDIIGAAEADVRAAQSEFDRHVEVTRLLLEGLSSSYAHHQRCLLDFIEAQAVYYAQCHKCIVDLQKQLGMVAGTTDIGSAASSNNATSYSPANLAPVATTAAAPATLQSAGAGMQAVSQYDSSGMTELSLLTDEDSQVFDQ